MTTIEITRRIDALAPRVWSALADFGGIYKFHPLVERSPLLTSQGRGVGAERRCEFADGSHVCERIIGWDEGRSLEVELYDGSMPLASAQGTITVAPTPSGSEVTFAFTYVPSMGVLGKLMDVLMMKRQLSKTLDGVLRGLETHLATGATIGEDGAPIVSAA